MASLLTGCLLSAAPPPKAATDPRVTSVYPFVIPAGVKSTILIRGSALAGARLLLFDSKAIEARVVGVDQEPVKDGPPIDLVRAEVTAPAAGKHPFRLVSTQGVTNELPLQISAAPVVEETAAISNFPVTVAGKIATRGEVDTIWIETKPGDMLTFSATSGAAGFDPSLTLAEPTGSWFDNERLTRLAFNDEPLYFPGLSFDARLVHSFPKGGRFAIQIRAFSGAGGPDFTYMLSIVKGVGEPPALRPRLAPLWEERQFTRRMGDEWLGQLDLRGGRPADRKPLAIATGSATTAATLSIPGVAEGRIRKPAEVHRYRIKLDKPQDLALEVETPEATMPRFNPVVRLLAPDESELVTNVYTKRNNNGLYMMKMIQAKSTFSLRAAGEYVLEIRDITTDVAADDFAYRILLRPQIPHIGKAEVTEDRLNLEPGQSKALTVNLEREEGFAGLVLLSAEGLPPGVTATAGMANPIERPPLPNAGRLERYIGKPQTATIILSAAGDAKPGDLPATVQIQVRTIVDGHPSPALRIKDIPVLVIPRRTS